MKLEIDIDVAEELVEKRRLEQELRKEAVLRLFAQRRIPAGLATRLLGLTRLQFLDLLQQRGMPHIVYTFEDWQEDLANLETIRSEQDLT